MSEFYEMGVKLALEDVSKAFKLTSSSSMKSDFKMPKAQKPKLPTKPPAPPKMTTSMPKPAPTTSPDTGPWGERYGGRGTQVRNV